jgi:transcriptional regulator with XRE-family HTH domain
MKQIVSRELPKELSKELSKEPADQLSARQCRDRLMFAISVRMARAALGWSQVELGRLLGMSQRAIHRIEQAHSAPRRTTLLAIENIFTKAGLKIENRGDGGFCIVVPASALGESGLAPDVAPPRLSDSPPLSDDHEAGEPVEAETLR